MEPDDNDRWPVMMEMGRQRADGTDPEVAIYILDAVARRAGWLMFTVGAMVGYTLTLIAR